MKLINLNPSVNWNNITNKPTLFPPEDHSHTSTRSLLPRFNASTVNQGNLSIFLLDGTPDKLFLIGNFAILSPFSSGQSVDLFNGGISSSQTRIICFGTNGVVGYLQGATGGVVSFVSFSSLPANAVIWCNGII